MTMPCTLTIADKKSDLQISKIISALKSYLNKVDETFSIFNKTSEISRINQKLLDKTKASSPVQQVLKLCEETKSLTNGFFEIEENGQIDTNGMVKGWAINESAKLLEQMGLRNYLLEIAGDMQTSGHPIGEKFWSVGIRNPFDTTEIIKKVGLSGEGIATSGTYLRGTHIYNPIKKAPAGEILSLTVIAKNIYEADRFATAAFAMG